jgi:hypothetical protein
MWDFKQKQVDFSRSFCLIIHLGADLGVTRGSPRIAGISGPALGFDPAGDSHISILLDGHLLHYPPTVRFRRGSNEQGRYSFVCLCKRVSLREAGKIRLCSQASHQAWHKISEPDSVFSKS